MLNFAPFRRPSLRVAFLTPGLSPGGAEQWILSLCRNFTRCKPVSCMVTSEPIPGELAPKVQHYCPVIPVTETMTLAKVIKQGTQNADVVVAWGYPDLTGIIEKLDIPVLLVSHATTRPDWARVTANFLAAVSGPSAAVFTDAEQRRCRPKIIHNGVSLDRVAPRMGGVWQRECWDVPQQAKLALYLGRFSPEKNPERFLNAVEFLPDNWLAGLIGFGPQTEYLINTVAPRVVRDVTFDNDPATPPRYNTSNIFFPQPTFDHVGDYLAAADVVVIPSKQEACPMVLIEAIMAGIPLACSEALLPILDELRSRSGLAHPFAFVSRGDSPQALANAIQAAGAMGENREAMIHLGRMQSFATHQLSAGSMAAQWEEHLFSIVQHWQEIGKHGTVEYIPGRIDPSTRKFPNALSEHELSSAGVAVDDRRSPSPDLLDDFPTEPVPDCGCGEPAQPATDPNSGSDSGRQAFDVAGPAQQSGMVGGPLGSDLPSSEPQPLQDPEA